MTKNDKNIMRAMLIEEDAPALAVRRLTEALGATTLAGTPDHRARTEAAKTILYQVDGKPVERVHTITETRGSTQQSLPELLKSPAFRSGLLDLLRESPDDAEALLAELRTTNPTTLSAL